jgi:hypothetical protein
MIKDAYVNLKRREENFKQKYRRRKNKLNDDINQTKINDF